ncbi:phosphate ABC transporter permease PstA [Halobellus clavatus]|uniref:Phosphate transport system permease protein PstA n=1 Tax=Halobellus clavatus TaxID=660517 RepID=A0A1H3KFU0_9EURY|nr:phosphate ABC transporter permease PstA [Halobellus clavatus]SDY50899.1 phosphate transport system permease protein [Halobellus clavatus]
MATGSSQIEDFGQVSRTVGTIFRYLILAATLFGIVVLAALLVYVANDALQPATADPGWYLTFFLTLVAPTALVGWAVHRRGPAAFTFGSFLVGLLVVSLMFSGGVGLLVVDVVPPLVGFSFAIAIAVPTAISVFLTRYSHRIGFTSRLSATAFVFYLSLFGLPGPIGSPIGVPQVVPSLARAIQSIPVIPVDWMMVGTVLGGIGGAVVGSYVAGVRDARTGLVAGGLAFAATLVSAVVGPFVGLNPVPSTVLTAVTVLPTATYAWRGAFTEERRPAGLGFAAVVVGGALVGAAATSTLGFAGPQSWVDWQFLTSAHSGSAENAGLYPAIGGSILLMATVAALSFPIGVGAAVYLEEYAPDNRLTRFVDVNISNLAGVPSVVYGLLGLGVFVTYLGQAAGTVIVGGATLALLILPIVIISSREAIRSVPSNMRQASYGMGATRWQTVKNVILPEAFPGILTGTILALGRAIGETAPLIMIAAPNVVFSLPTALESKVSAMPLQVYAWSSLFASEDFYTKAVPAGVVVLLAVLLAMNSIAIVLRNRFERTG